jgi:dTDP-glucose 4,6-dehydratase
MAYANTYKLPITIAATMNLVGERQHHEKYVPMVIRRALSGETVVIHANPERTKSGTRFYLHCRTYAHALGFLIARDGAGLQMPQKVNICGEREISNLDLAQFIATVVGNPLRYELVDFHSSRPGHDLAYRMRDDLIRSLGWKRPMNLEQSLEKTVRWYLANPKWLGL